ncbi:hypothetical protein QVD99_005382 [Batrachochytrium dendrobatidis]|nr:hypothetical protein QVD99_005382 [Batrachochytrium dendrobatidis]
MDTLLTDEILNDIYKSAYLVLQQSSQFIPSIHCYNLISKRPLEFSKIELDASSHSCAPLTTPRSISAMQNAIFSNPTEIIQFLQNNPDLIGLFPIPREPNLSLDLPILSHIHSIQEYIQTLSYNYLGEPFFVVKKSSSVRNLLKLAQKMVQQALPIKCLEATILGIYLTMKFDDLLRMTVSFKSECNGEIYRHIVLIIKLGGKWGAIGLSKKSDLMNKSLTYTSLSELMENYKTCYEKNNHTLLKIKLGLPVTHNPASNEKIVWKKSSIRLQDTLWDISSKEIDAHSRSLRSL